MTNGPAPPATPWWDAARHADRRPFLLARGRIVTALRTWFADEGFVEVEPGILQVSPGNETHLHAFATAFRDPAGQEQAGQEQALYLHTSPEFAAKKLLAAGEPRIVAFARVFRNRDRSPIHAPEFTMVEWYRAGEPYERLMADCAAILRRAATAAGATVLRHREAEADPELPPERLTTAEAFARFASIDLLATIHSDETASREALAGAAAAQGIRVAPDDTWSDVFSRVLAERVEPHLGRGRATILCEYPAPEAALARPKPGDPRVAERFELYAAGMELANGFGELTDPAEQRRRFTADMDEKARLYGERYPIDEDFLAALAQMPPASGCALGLDRLVMLATGAPSIDLVQWTPFPGGA